jgi:hypothetical protein
LQTSVRSIHTSVLLGIRGACLTRYLPISWHVTLACHYTTGCSGFRETFRGVPPVDLTGSLAYTVGALRDTDTQGDNLPYAIGARADSLPVARTMLDPPEGGREQRKAAGPEQGSENGRELAAYLRCRRPQPSASRSNR